jgi:histidinol phosphatase-like PHP family hydrolase
MKKIDTHFHTKLSDWSRNNDEVIREAKQKWIDFIAPTEHDIINDELILSAKMNWMACVSWVEISSNDDIATWKSLHLTCYSNNFWTQIRDILENTREKRKLKVRKQVERLQSNWFNINYEKFIRFYKNLDFNIDNINNFQLEDYVFQNEDNIDKLLMSLVWVKMERWEFIQKCLKRNGEFRDIWWDEVEKYEPSVSKIWDIARENNYFLSLAHPNFTFRKNEQWFLDFIEQYHNKFNWIEINSKATEDWVKLIVDTSVKYGMILTFWSDSHHKWSDSKHWDLWDMNEFVTSKMIEENFEDFLYELSKWQ